MSNSENHDLKPPASVLKIAGFLSDIKKHHELGAKYEVGDIWDQHSISVSNIGDFVSWLHVDRKEAVPPERQLAEEPQKTFAKKNEDSETQPDDRLDAALEGGTPDSPINIHLWKAILQPEVKQKRREMPQSPLSLNRNQSFAKDYNGGLFLAQINLTQQANQDAIAAASHATQAVQESGAAKVPAHITTGLASQEFGNSVVDRNAPATPVWNEPVRRDLKSQLVAQARANEAEQLAPTQNLLGSNIAKAGVLGAAGLMTGLPDLSIPMDIGRREASPGVKAENEPLADRLFGQITLVAPPLQVSPSGGQGAVGLTFDWRDMAKGAGPVDYPTLITIAKTLPEGSRMLYPAIDPRHLRGEAINLKLEPRVAEGLAGSGFGPTAAIDGKKSLRQAYDYDGGMPAVSLLPATLSPLDQPSRKAIGMSPDNLPQGDMGVPAEGPERRMRFLDFFGLPIYLSPHLNTDPDTDQEMKARVTAEFLPRAPLVSPQTFGVLRGQMLGGFYGVEAKPELGAWRSAAPSYDRAGSSIAGMLSSRIRMGGMGDGIVSPFAPIPRSSSMPIRGAGSKFGPTFLPKLPGSALARSAPLQVSPFLPPSIPAPSPVSGSQMTTHTAGTQSVSTITPQPMGFRQTIPSAPAASDSTAPMGQSATAPVGANPSVSMGINRSSQIPAEKATTSPPSMPVRQSMPGTGSSDSSSAMATPQPSLMPPAMAAIAPQSQFPRPVSAPSKPKTPSEVMPPKQGASERTSSSSTPLRPPTMAIAPPKPTQGAKAESESMTVQTSAATPGSASEVGGNRSAEVAQRQQSGLPGSEVNLLATEVWSLLKRRLAFEAQRAGR